jgi:hypothetical protein
VNHARTESRCGYCVMWIQGGRTRGS